jgi:NAD(P)-dependent dehydrogenase (short-subunit alcohol dehydrogenase family)
VRGLLFTIQKALPLLSKGFSVILTGSMVSIKGFAACSVYNAPKAAVRSFARTWIVDLKGRDIRINVLSPGYTDTPGLAHFVTDQDKAAMVASVPLGRLGTPDDLARRRCSSLPRTAPTSPALSCLSTVVPLRSE